MTPCLACGSMSLEPWATARDAEYHAVPERFSYGLCRDCGCLSIDPVPAGRLAEIYPSSYYSFARQDASFIERLKLYLDRRLLRSVLGGCPGESLAVLDVGGGTGWMLDQARGADPRVRDTLVVDLDPSARPFAEAAGHRFVAGRIEDLAGDERFDLVLLLNLIEHVADPVGVLRSLGARLKPGGRILLKTPNHDSLDARLFRHAYWGGLHCPRHWVLFTPAALRLAAARAGLVVQRQSLTQGAPFWAWSVLDALERRGFVRVDAARPMHRHPLVPLLLALFGALDLARSPFMATSQMFAVLGPMPDTGPITGPVQRHPPAPVRPA
jgi:2-polyprenyl-3-methyl-5-hydroxy-6-metoxy-1,4-benzoquinol methylase